MGLIIGLAAILGLTGCGSVDGNSTPPTGSPAATRATSADEDSPWLAQWSRNCVLCHVRGEGGAPVLGDQEAWAPRLAQGEDTLLQHTIEGFNNMPPLGYCMDCEEADFRRIIRFMGGER